MTRLLITMIAVAVSVTGCAAPDLPPGIVATRPDNVRAVRITQGEHAGRWMIPYTHRIPIHSGKTIAIEFVPIPGGTLTMGSPPDEPGRNKDEGPQVRVTVEPMWMGKYEVTWDQYDPYVTLYAYPSVRELSMQVPADREADAVSIPTPIWEQDALPVIQAMGRAGGYPASGMSSFTARMYTKFLSMYARDTFFRLPAEAEWEHAARGGTKTAYFWGDAASTLGDYALYLNNTDWEDENRGHPDIGAGYRKVGSKKPNPWGLHDVYGNVSEWCIDQHDSEHYAILAKRDQPVANSDAIRWPTNRWSSVTRGGHWDSDAVDCRSAARVTGTREWSAADPTLPQSLWHHTEYYMGMRLCRPLYPPSKQVQQKYWAPFDKESREGIHKHRQQRALVEWLTEALKPEAPESPDKPEANP